MPSGSGSAGGSPGGGGPDEWSAIRSVLSGFDTQLNDLRKTGLGVITALLTATAVSTLFNLPDYEVVVLILLTYVLIVIMQYLDQHYRTFQKAAMARARVIEPVLNVELSQKIATVYKEEHGYLVNPYLYSALILIACLLGCAIVCSGLFVNSAPAASSANSTILSANNSAVVSSGNATTLSTAVLVTVVPATASTPPAATIPVVLGYGYLVVLIFFAVVAIGWMVYISETVRPDYTRESTGLQDDWIVDRITCVKGDAVRITVTNLGEQVTEKTIEHSRETVTIPGLCDITVPTLNGEETVIRLGDRVTVTEKGWEITVAETGKKASVTKIGHTVSIPDLDEITVTKNSPDETAIQLGERVTIMVTKPDRRVTVTYGGLSFRDKVCDIRDKDGNIVDTISVSREVLIPINENHSWLWDTAPAHIGADALYCIWPKGWHDYPLAQITVLDRDTEDDRPKPEKIGDAGWTIDKASCEQGEVVTISVTNMNYPNGKDFHYHAGDVVCDILDDAHNPVKDCTIHAKTEITIPPDERYSWAWDTSGVKEVNAIYRIKPAKSEKPLKQSVTVLKKKPGSILGKIL